MQKRSFLYPLLIVLLSVSCICEANEYRIEFDRYQSDISGTSNVKSLYDVTQSIQDDIFEDVCFKLITSFPLTYCNLIIGHEYYGHGYNARKYDIDIKQYNILPPSVDLKLPENLYESSDIIIGGIRFNRKFEDLFLADGVINNFDYRKSIMLFQSRLITFRTMYDDEGSDFDLFIENAKSINPDTRIGKYLQRSINMTLIDPSFWLNCGMLTESFIMNEDIKYTFRFIPVVNFNIYPTAVTRTFGILIKNFRIDYEFGKNVYNNNIQGFNIEYINLPIKSWNIDMKLHIVKGCESSLLTTVNTENIYFRYKHQFKEYDTGYIFSIGLRF